MTKIIIPDDILVLRNQELRNSEKLYDIRVAAACYTNGGNELKLLFKLHDEDADFTFHILENLRVGSREYHVNSELFIARVDSSLRNLFKKHETTDWDEFLKAKIQEALLKEDIVNVYKRCVNDDANGNSRARGL